MKNIIFSIIMLLFAVTAFTQNIPHANHTVPWGLQVNTYNGNLYVQRNDLAIPNQGISIDFSFSYNSYRDTIDKGFGKGWLCSYSMEYFALHPDTLLLEHADGRLDTFAKNNGLFVAPDGIFDRWEEYQPAMYRLTTRQGMRYFFEDPVHRKLTRVEDTNGNFISLSYDAAGQLITVTDASNRSVSLSWNGASLAAVIDANWTPQRQISYAYTAEGQLSQITDPEGGILSYQYDNEGRLNTLYNQLGDELKILYETTGAVSDIVTCVAHVNFKYNTALGKTYVTEKNESGDRFTAYDYDDRGRLVQKTGSCCGYNTSYQYDNDNNVALLTDANGNPYNASHDDRGNAMLATDPMGASQNLAFEPSLNRLTSLVDKKGNTTTFEYDNQGNLTKINQPEGITNQFAYDAKGNLILLTDGNQHQNIFQYNLNNDVTNIQYPIGNETFHYDAVGNLTQSTDGNGNPVNYFYDKLNRLTRITDAIGNEVSFVYDGASNLTEETDANGNTKQYDYDPHQRLQSVTTPAGTTHYTYDASDNLSRITDANSHENHFAYDNRNLLIEERDALGYATSYSYDGNGNVITRTDANGNVSSYTYDALNRLTSKNYNGNTDNYEYDANGNLTRASNNHISISFQYDALNRLREKNIETWGKTIGYEYDGAGNRSKMTDPDGGETLYSYDANNRLISITNPAGETTVFTYDNGGRLVQQNYHNGSKANFTYDAANRLLSLVHSSSSGNTIASYTYTYDNNGNRLSMTDQSGGTASYTYDGDNRLVNVTYTGIIAPNQQFELDATGNRTLLNNGGVETAYAYDDADRLETAGTTSYDFDNNGNMVQKTTGNGQTTTYQYDGENRLLRVALPNGESVDFQYDPFGNRIAQQNTSGTTRYLLDGDNVLMELDDANTTLARYTAGLSLDSWISMERGGQSYFYHTDGLGSITALTNGAQTVAATYRYDAYGNMLSQTGNVPNPYTYTGREFDAATGLYYYRTRFYDATVGRFLTRDDFPLDKNNPNTINRYLYIESNPINYVDPTGEIAFLPFIYAAIGGASFGAGVDGLYQYFSEGRTLECWDWQSTIFNGVLGAGGGIAVKLTTFIGSKLVFFGKTVQKKLNFREVYKELYHKGKNLHKPLVRFSKSPKGGRTSINAMMKNDLILIPTISGIASFIKKFFDPSDSDTGCNEKSGSQESTIDQLLPNLPEVTIPIIRAFDPNEILSPTGCGTDRWVTKNATLPYTILFENSPDFATAPAQRVVIELPLDEDLQAESFRVGNFGFGNYYFTVPANVSYYNAQLDLSDSLGVLLDVVAGVDVNSAPPRAFWIFESKDPATGLAANLPANAGFLPVNDTLSHIGEGFVNFTLRAHSTAVTYDTLHARAAIIFDDNPPILTNLAFNLLDADLPASHITDIDTLAGDQLLLSFLGDDVGSGIAGYTLYISENGGPFLPLVANLSGDNYTFQGTPGSSYEFFLIATDCAGNVEPLKNGAELECALSLTLSQTPSTNGQSNGSASVQVAGNLGSLSYLWSNNATTASINNVPAGTYSVSVTDGLGCSNFGTITVDNVTGTASINKLFIQRIYPSPAPNNVNVEFFSPDSVVFIELYDARGNKLSGRSMRVNAGIINTIQLDVSELPTANYLIVVRLKDAVISGIFMKG